MGGAPSLAEENVGRLREPGVSVVAMNNAASVCQDAVDFWVSGDRPGCYSKRILLDQKMTKFALISRRDFDVDGRPWRQMPRTFFYGTTEKFTVDNFLKPSRDYVWWKNTFYIALQVTHRLGFRKVYLAGCSFRADGERDYSYGVRLSASEKDWNRGVYSKTVAKMKELKPTFKREHFEVVSVTRDSLLNDSYPSMDFDDAIDQETDGFPQGYMFDECKHSSAYKKEEARDGDDKRSVA